jgi:NodT family efflux transporter outer membrane factor (OMF) lipoprotein
MRTDMSVQTRLMHSRRLLGVRFPPGGQLASLLVTAVLCGCAVGPNYVAPSPPTEQAYIPAPSSQTGDAESAATEQRVVTGAGPQAAWWTLLGSPEIDQIVALALSNNRTLDVAKSNLAEAKEAVTAARGALYPQVDAAGGLARQQYGASFLGPEAFEFPTFSAYTAGVGVSYDPDVFGGNHRRIELAAADAEVHSDDLAATRLGIAGDTVIEALQIASLRAQMQVVQEVIASDAQTLKLVRTANGAGVASRTDITTAQSQLDRDRALLPILRQQLDASRDALAILVGKSPATWTAPDFDLAEITLPRDVPLVVPSELVRARPDIRAAEAQLHAANAAVGVATADLYPKLTLSADIAEQGLTSGPAGAAWSLVGGVTAPIFHGGTLKARQRGARDAYDAALAQYQQTVLVAFQQVADNLHGLANTADEMQTQQQALDSAGAALTLTRLGYGVGNAGIVQVLDAQRLQQLAELGLVQARTQRYVQTVNLILATGGGLGDGRPEIASRTSPNLAPRAAHAESD